MHRFTTTTPASALRTPICVALVVAATILAPGAVRGDWPINGVKVLDALVGGIVTDGAGGALVAGTNEVPQADCFYGVRFGRVDGAGNVLVGGGQGQILYCQDYQFSSDASYEALVPDGFGNAFVAYVQHPWTTGSYQVYLSKFGGTGALQWPFRYIPQGNVVSDGVGGVYTYGTFIEIHSDYRAYLRHYDSAGGLAWSREFDLYYGGACEDAHGGVIVSWRDDSSRVQRFAAAGMPLWRDGGVALQVGRGLITDDRGGAWIFNIQSDAQARILHVDSTGAVASPWPAEGAPTFGFGAGKRDGSGGLFLIRHFAGGDLRVIRAIDGGFHPRWGGAQGLTVATTLDEVAYNSREYDIAPDGRGGAYVAWEDARGVDGKFDIYATHIFSDGTFDPAWAPGGEPLCAAEFDQRDPMLMVDGDVVIAAWTDYRHSAAGGYRAVYAQRVDPGRVTPTLLSRISASVDGGRVHLRWFSTDHASHGIVQRRSDDLLWAPVRTVFSDDRGFLDFEDDAVAPGARYGYRFEGPEGAILDEVWLDVPAAADLRFRIGPNPSAAGVIAEFTLPEPGRARLSLFDVSGRRREDLQLGLLGTGQHTAVLARPGSLEPGIYVVRFAAGGREQVRRIVITR